MYIPYWIHRSLKGLFISMGLRFGQNDIESQFIDTILTSRLNSIVTGIIMLLYAVFSVITVGLQLKFALGISLFLPYYLSYIIAMALTMLSSIMFIISTMLFFILTSRGCSCALWSSLRAIGKRRLLAWATSCSFCAFFFLLVRNLFDSTYESSMFRYAVQRSLLPDVNVSGDGDLIPWNDLCAFANFSGTFGHIDISGAYMYLISHV